MPIPSYELGRFAVVAIGSSTGAPALVQHILAGLPADLPMPILIAQHMPPVFTESFSRHLAHASPLAVYHAEDGMPVLPGTVYVGVGHRHLRVQRQGGQVTLVVSEEPKHLLYKPAADELFASCAEVYGRHTLAVVLTGMGKDGVVGAKQVYDKGGVVLTQSRETCVVYGMPKACDDAGISAAQLSPEEIRRAILQLSPQHRSQAGV